MATTVTSELAYRRNQEDEYLNHAKPSWYAEHTRRKPVELHLDLSKYYSSDEYWQGISLMDRDPGMPIIHRHWCFHLVDNFVPSLTSLNLQKCNFGDKGLEEFILVLKVNTGLRSLNLKDNNLSSRQVNLFLDALEETNFTITNLEFEEGKKTALAKNKYQHDSVSIASVTSEIMAGESEVDAFQNIKKRCQRITNFNSRVCKVIDGQTDKVELIFHESKPGDLTARCHPGGSKGKEFRNDRFALMLTMMSNNLKSLTLDRWYPLSLKGDRKWFEELPLEDQQLRTEWDNKIPSELFNLPNLTELRFYDCVDPLTGSTFFRTIPQDITKLTQLKNLVISRCGLETVEEPLDQGIVPGKLSSAGSLDRSVLYKLRNLQTLGLPGNLLKKIPETIGYCTSLTRLSIGNNKLEQLPDSILLLSNLRELWAHDNYIWKVPVSLPKYCPNLEDLRILQQGDDERKSSLIPGDEKELKSLKEAEKAISSTKTKFGDIVNYMKQFLNDRKTIRLNRYKLVVVGDGAVGKTTTIRSLQLHAASAYKKKKNENILDNVATDGVAIQMLRLPAGAKRTPGYIGGNECLNFSCWDFAGQDVYTYSHTFFMTEKSLYLIGFDCKGGDSSAGIERVDYWLQVVRSRFPNAYCVVFGTHIDELGKEEFKNLQKKITARYKSKPSKDRTTKDPYKVSNIAFISNSTGKGLSELISDIKKFPTYLDKVKKRKNSEDEIPMNWLILEERGKAVGATRVVPIISWAEWLSLAQRELQMDEVTLREATAYWHECGSLSWFDEDGLRDIVCLRPDFLTDVFSAVISAKTGLSSGILKHDALIQIWKGLPWYLYPHMLNILEKFEILHKLEGDTLKEDAFGSALVQATGLTPNGSSSVVVDFGTTNQQFGTQTMNMFQGRSIIPAMLPEQEPPQAELAKCWPMLPKGAVELQRIYTFDFVPNGFFARLLVRLLHSKWRASIWWRWGIVLSKNMAKLFLTFEGKTKTMTLRVRGPQNVSKVGSLIDSISTLISDWLSQVDITIKIPYTYPDGQTVVFDWKDIERAAQNGRPFVDAPGTISPGTKKDKKDFSGSGLLPVRIDNLAPDLALLTNSTKVFTEAELNVGKELGRGGFAVVLKGTLPNGDPVACKKLIFDKSQEESGETTFSDIFTEFRREVWLMSSLQHNNLVRLLGVCTQPNLMMVLEFMEGGTLHDYLHGDEKTPKATLSLDDKFELALHVARGMQFMHGLNPPIIHRDLKSPNILMTYRGPDGSKLAIPVPKIADFGLSRGLQWTTSMSDKVVDNPCWLAPEVMSKKPYNEKVDVYSYGVILYEIITQIHFLDDIKFDYQKEDAVKKGIRPAIPSDVHPVLSSLVNFCWAQDPNQRPSFDQIVECLENKTVIESARPSALNYGTGFEDFDDFDHEQSQSSPLPGSSHAKLTKQLGTAPPPLVAPTLDCVSSASNVASSSSSIASSSSSLNITSTSSPNLSTNSQQKIDLNPTSSTPTETRPAQISPNSSVSPKAQEEHPTPSNASNSPAPLPRSKSGWAFAVPRKSEGVRMELPVRGESPSPPPQPNSSS